MDGVRVRLARGDELLHKGVLVTLQELRPEVVQVREQQAFDVRAVLILIAHEHNAAVAQWPRPAQQCAVSCQMRS